MRRIAILVSGALCLFLSAAPLAAQTGPKDAHCPERDQLLDLAGRILTQRTDIKGFGSANFGTEAAYLILRYTNPTTEAGLRMLEQFAKTGRRPPRQIDDLALTFAISTAGVDQGFRMAGQDRLEGFANGNTDVWQAIIRADNGVTFFDLVYQVRSDDRLAKIFEQNYLGGNTLMSVFVGMDDAALVQISQLAEAAGEFRLAADLLASASELSPFNDLITRHPQNQELSLFTPSYTLGYLIHAKTSPQPVGAQTFHASPQGFYNIVRASVLIGEMDFLLVLHNQTGLTDEIGAAATAFLTELESGSRPALDNLEDNWLFLYDQIAKRYPLNKLQLDMSAFVLPNRMRHYSASAQTTMDWMRAIRDIGPYLTGDQAKPPARPQNLSNGFDWSTWARLASDIRQGRLVDPTTPEQAQMQAELLLTAGQTEAAIDFANKSMQPAPRLRFYRDLMKRIDRRCAAFSVSPGQGMYLGGTVAYRF